MTAHDRPPGPEADPIAETIARVRELDAAAAKGPWVGEEQDCEPGEWEVLDSAGKTVARYVRVRCYESCTIYDGITAENAALIAEYRTAAPQLADECERLRERVAELTEALRALDEFGHLACVVDPACGCCTKCDAREALKGC